MMYQNKQIYLLKCLFRTFQIIRTVETFSILQPDCSLIIPKQKYNLNDLTLATLTDQTLFNIRGIFREKKNFTVLPILDEKMNYRTR